MLQNVCVYQSCFLYFIKQPFKKLYHFISMDVVPACMSVNHVHVYVQCPRRLERPEESFRSSETGDIDILSYHVGTEN